MSVLWGVQSNCMQERIKTVIETALKELKIPFEPLYVKLFSDELPKTSTTDMIFYGSTTLTYAVHESGKFNPGVYITDDFSNLNLLFLVLITFSGNSFNRVLTILNVFLP